MYAEIRETIVCITFFASLIGSVIVSWARERGALIKENVVIFYPKNFSDEKHLPSFALLKEPNQPDILIRPGEILPLGKVILTTKDYKVDRICLLISFDKYNKASGVLYHNACDGYNYKDG